jgi:hypothetical protein
LSSYPVASIFVMVVLQDSTLITHDSTIRFRKSLDADKVGLSALASRALGLLAMHLGEECFQRPLERFILSTLVEFADEVAACLERVIGESQSGPTKVLYE